MSKQDKEMAKKMPTNEVSISQTLSGSASASASGSGSGDFQLNTDPIHVEFTITVNWNNKELGSSITPVAFRITFGKDDELGKCQFECNFFSSPKVSSEIQPNRFNWFKEIFLMQDGKVTTEGENIVVFPNCKFSGSLQPLCVIMTKDDTAKGIVTSKHEKDKRAFLHKYIRLNFEQEYKIKLIFPFSKALMEALNLKEINTKMEYRTKEKKPLSMVKGPTDQNYLAKGRFDFEDFSMAHFQKQFQQRLVSVVSEADMSDNNKISSELKAKKLKIESMKQAVKKMPMKKPYANTALLSATEKFELPQVNLQDKFYEISPFSPKDTKETVEKTGVASSSSSAMSVAKLSSNEDAIKISMKFKPDWHQDKLVACQLKYFTPVRFCIQFVTNENGTLITKEPIGQVIFNLYSSVSRYSSATGIPVDNIRLAKNNQIPEIYSNYVRKNKFTKFNPLEIILSKTNAEEKFGLVVNKCSAKEDYSNFRILQGGLYEIDFYFSYNDELLNMLKQKQIKMKVFYVLQKRVDNRVQVFGAPRLISECNFVYSMGKHRFLENDYTGTQVKRVNGTKQSNNINMPVVASVNSEIEMLDDMDDTKVEKTRLEDRVTLRTRAGGDCAFHALLGQWNVTSKMIEIDNIVKKREQVAHAIMQVQQDSSIYPLIVSAIQDMLMSEGTSFSSLRTAYQKNLLDNEKTMINVRSKLEQGLKSHEEIADYIASKVHNKPNLVSFNQQFQHCLTLEGGILFALILSLEPLNKLMNEYKREANKTFNLHENILKSPTVLEEYAKHIQKPGQYLLPCELNILAIIFDVKVDYCTYNLNTKSYSYPEILNPGGRTEVGICFNGFGHFERMDLDALAIIDFQEKLKNGIPKVVSKVSVSASASASTSAFTAPIPASTSTLVPVSTLTSATVPAWSPEWASAWSSAIKEATDLPPGMKRNLSAKPIIPAATDLPPGMKRNLSANPIIPAATDLPPGIKPRKPIIVVRPIAVRPADRFGGMANALGTSNVVQAGGVQPNPPNLIRIPFTSCYVPFETYNPSPLGCASQASPTAAAPTLHAGMKRKTPSA